MSKRQIGKKAFESCRQREDMVSALGSVSSRISRCSLTHLQVRKLGWEESIGSTSMKSFSATVDWQVGHGGSWKVKWRVRRKDERRDGGRGECIRGF